MEERKAPRNGLIDVMRLGFAGIVKMHFLFQWEEVFSGRGLWCRVFHNFGWPIDVFGMGEASSFGAAFKGTTAVLAGVYEKTVC